jgi:hypothetical protein
MPDSVFVFPLPRAINAVRPEAADLRHLRRPMSPLAGRYRPDRLQDLVQQDKRRPEAVPARTVNRLGRTERRQNPSCTAPS